MCLEDQFLIALYNQPGFVTVTEMAAKLSITETALTSIIHRIKGAHAHFIIHDEMTDAALLSPNMPVQNEVRLFLADGGFTAINEQELRAYYRAEMERYLKLEQMREALKQHGWIKWAAGFGFLLGSGAVLMQFLKQRRKQNYFSNFFERK